jgi:hypothetical protein
MTTSSTPVPPPIKNDWLTNETVRRATPPITNDQRKTAPILPQTPRPAPSNFFAVLHSF